MPEMDTQFPSSWQRQTLEDCMSAIIDYRGKSPSKTLHGIPLITARVVKAGRILAPAEFIAVEEYDEWMRRGIPQPGDIVMTTEAPLGEVAQLGDQKVALAQRLITLRGKPGLLDNTFLKFLLQSRFVQDELKARATGTTVLGIRQSALRKLLLPIPPIEEQERIAEILGALDDKIELDRRMNETLEAIAHANFKSWFVDFDPVRTKAHGEQPAGMAASLVEAFPSKLVASGLGSIPEGWPCKPLPEVIAVNPVRVLDKEIVAPYVDMGNMPTHSARVLGWIDREFTSGMRFKNGDTLVARITPCLENGKTAFVDFLRDQQIAWGSTEFIVLHPNLPLPPEYGYFLARSAEFRAFAVSNMSGTSGRQRVPADCFASFYVAVPPKPIAMAFGELAKSFFSKMKQNDEESATLALLRDALLSKLLSGEVRIKQVEKIVEARA
jgi:type I restriction enzyme, S subunit